MLYPTDDGDEVAQVVWAPQWVSEEIGGLPVLTGPAGPDAEQAAAASRKKRAAARVAARRLIREHELPMKIAGIDHRARRQPRDDLLHRRRTGWTSARWCAISARR